MPAVREASLGKLRAGSGPLEIACTRCGGRDVSIVIAWGRGYISVVCYGCGGGGAGETGVRPPAVSAGVDAQASGGEEGAAGIGAAVPPPKPKKGTREYERDRKRRQRARKRDG